jgi:hypothetical protein
MVGIVVGVLHLVGYVPPRYRRMLSDVQASTAKAITDALGVEFSKMIPDGVEDAVNPETALAPLTARLDALPAAIGTELTKALSQAQEAALAEMSSLPPEVTGAIGGLTKASNAKSADLRNAIGQGLLGPYGSLLQQFMPPLYDYLTENPDMVVQALEMPVVQKLIQKAASMAGQVTMQTSEGSGGWR